jgi:hypothetical protein
VPEMADDRALWLYTGTLGVEINRAHALLSFARIDEAQIFFFAHKGEKVPDNADKLWEQVIADDCSEFRKAISQI